MLRIARVAAARGVPAPRSDSTSSAGITGIAAVLAVAATHSVTAAGTAASPDAFYTTATAHLGIATATFRASATAARAAVALAAVALATIALAAVALAAAIARAITLGKGRVPREKHCADEHNQPPPEHRRPS